MLPKEVSGIRFLQLYPQFIESFIDERVSEAYQDVRKSDEYASHELQSELIYRELSDLICEQQKQLLFKLDSVINDMRGEEDRCCYLKGLQDGLEYAKGGNGNE
jgi:hypothetical protein